MLPIFYEILRQEDRRRENSIFRRRRRSLRNQFNVEDIPEARFIELFRVSKTIYGDLCEMLIPHLRSPRYRSGISVEVKILVALSFYATGAYQRSIGEVFNLSISQTAVQRCIHDVTDAIHQHLTAQYIRFPTNREDQNAMKQLFMEKFNFPSCIGAIDCTHVAILKPKEEEHNFINRKGFHSLNVQIICDPDMRIMGINSNYGGSTHDAFIWSNSRIKEYLHAEYLRGNQNTCLIGDSGYPLEPYLLTPFRNPVEGSPESRYNYSHIRARNCVERCIGLLKMRFRCLLKERVCRYPPDYVGKIVSACAVMHNMCIIHNLHIEENLQVPENEINHNNLPPNVHLLRLGERMRNNIVNRYFTN